MFRFHKKTASRICGRGVAGALRHGSEIHVDVRRDIYLTPGGVGRWEGPFSAVSEPIFQVKLHVAVFFQDLRLARLCTAPNSRVSLFRIISDKFPDSCTGSLKIQVNLSVLVEILTE